MTFGKSCTLIQPIQSSDFIFTHRLNPPLPVDYDGNWYREDSGDDASDVGEDDDGLTPEERAILADIDSIND